MDWVAAPTRRGIQLQTLVLRRVERRETISLPETIEILRWLMVYVLRVRRNLARPRLRVHIRCVRVRVSCVRSLPEVGWFGPGASRWDVYTRWWWDRQSRGEGTAALLGSSRLATHVPPNSVGARSGTEVTPEDVPCLSAAFARARWVSLI